MKIFTARKIMTAIAAAVIATGCVHEWPHGMEEPETPPEEVKSRRMRLQLKHDRQMDTLGIFNYSGQRAIAARSTIDEAMTPHDVRHTINIFPIASRNDVSRSPSASYVFTHKSDADCDETIEIDVPIGEYRVVAWTDYVTAGSTTDKYYDTTDFNEIQLATRGTHYGSNEWRKVWRGATDISIEGAEPTARPDTLGVYDKTVNLTQPTARYTFISTDLRRFLDGEHVRRAEDIDGCTVKMIYTRYMCSSYNAITGKPADSWTGVCYDSRIEILNDSEARIGFDHVFVNGDRTSVNVAVQVLDRQGNVLATIPGFDVPLERGRHTIVKGEFLTSTAGGDIGINPDFNGDFNIEIK